MVRVMKRLFLMTIAVLALVGVPAAQAEGGVTLLLQGCHEADVFDVDLSADGRTYEIESKAALEVGSGICWHPEGMVTRLTCEAPAISGFELNGGKGDDLLTLGRRVAVPATLRGGSGKDKLQGGNGADKLIGGGGVDSLAGGGGADLIEGGNGNDSLYGRSGDDKLCGGVGDDRLWGGTGNDKLLGEAGDDVLIGGPGSDVLSGGPGINATQQ